MNNEDAAGVGTMLVNRSHRVFMTLCLTHHRTSALMCFSCVLSARVAGFL